MFAGIGGVLAHAPATNASANRAESSIFDLIASPQVTAAIPRLNQAAEQSFGLPAGGEEAHPQSRGFLGKRVRAAALPRSQDRDARS
jgi:hypothetical protein